MSFIVLQFEVRYTPSETTTHKARMTDVREFDRVDKSHARSP